METTINYWGFVIGIIGLILTVYSIIVQVRSNKKKEPVFSLKSINLIRNSITQYQNLSVLFSNKKVESFTVSKVIFYNKGSEVINREDIVSGEPIRIASKEGVKILGAKILQSSKSANQFSANLSKSKNCVLLDFEYLSRNEGAVIEVMHTGVSSSDLEILGVIKDVPQIKRLVIFKKLFNFFGRLLFEGRLKYLAPAIAIGFPLVFIPLFLWQVISVDTLNEYRHSIGLTQDVSVAEGILGLFMSITMSILAGGMMIPFYRSRMKQAPKGLDIYDAE